MDSNITFLSKKIVVQKSNLLYNNFQEVQVRFFGLRSNLMSFDDLETLLVSNQEYSRWKVAQHDKTCQDDLKTIKILGVFILIIQILIVLKMCN